jgi:hypothetical protein
MEHTLHAARFWAFVEKTDGCWTWKGSFYNSGYGRFSVGGRWYSAHRFAWVLAFGSPAAEPHLHHKCENKACVRPDHLEPVTPRVHVLERTLTSVSAINLRKTHCLEGHEFTPENTYWYRGWRQCQECRRLRNIKLLEAKQSGVQPVHIHRPDKTHCKRGHEFTPENTYVHRGARYCKQCNRDSQARRRAA